MIQRPQKARTLNEAEAFFLKYGFFFFLTMFSLILITTICVTLFQIGSVTTRGTVLYCGPTNTRSCQPMVSFRTQSGQQRTFLSGNGHRFLKPGDTISVRYHPATPQDAFEDPFPLLYVVLAISGSLLTGAFLILRYWGIPIPILARLKRARNLLQHSKRPRLSELQSKEYLKERREEVRRRTGAPKAVLVRLRRLNQQLQKRQK